MKDFKVQERSLNSPRDTIQWSNPNNLIFFFYCDDFDPDHLNPKPFTTKAFFPPFLFTAVKKKSKVNET
jgi:hypothetical protein